MPTTIPLTDRQRSAILQLMADAGAARQRIDAYIGGIVDGAAGVPAKYGAATLTDAGLVLADAPGPPMSAMPMPTRDVIPPRVRNGNGAKR